MKILPNDEAGLLAAAEALKSGKLGIIPTDTVYGLAAHPDIPSAVDGLYAAKSRPREKPIALLIDGPESAARYIGPAAASLGARYWPGALTVVGRGEGARVPAHEWTRRLLRICGGALRVTSANVSGAMPVTECGAALSRAGLKCDFAVDDGVSPGGEASTVVKVGDDGAIELLREGPVKFLVLASGSPRRAKILRDAGVDFVVKKSDADEVSYPGAPERTVRENALAKGGGAPHTLSADTIVWFSGRIYGKPRDLNEAKAFLKELSGKVHSVYTGVAYEGEVKVVRSDVKFRELSQAQIDEYVARVNPVDRAGAYDIDESGDLIVESYSGSYENIMGLPLEPLAEWGIVKAKGGMAR